MRVCVRARLRRCKATRPEKSHEWRKWHRRNREKQQPAFQEWQTVRAEGHPEASGTAGDPDKTVGLVLEDEPEEGWPTADQPNTYK